MLGATKSPSFSSRYVWWTIGITLLLLLIYGSLAPSSVLQPPGSNDKLFHGFAYFSVMTWFAQMFASLRARCATALTLVAMGIGIEFIQPYVHRHFDWHDALANGGGVTLALLISLTRLRGVLDYVDLKLQQRAS